MTLPLQQRSVTTDLYSHALTAIWEFWDRVRDPSYALSQDVDIYEIMLRDPKVYQIIQERLHSVAGPEWRCFPFNNARGEADKKRAQVAEDALHQIEHFPDVRIKAATAIFRGQSMQLITGKRVMLNLAGTGKRIWWVPTKLKDIDPRRFTIRPIRSQREDGSWKVRGELYVSTIPMWGHPTADAGALANATLYNYRKVEHPEWFLRVIYGDEESRLGYGRGILDCMYYYHWIKQVVLREGLQGLERWAQGIVVGTLDPDAQGAPDTQGTDQQKAAMLDALGKMRSRYVYVQGKHDDVKVLTGGGEGHQMVEGWLRYLDDCLTAVGTGAVLASSGSNVGDAGSYARDKAGQDTQKGVVAYDKNKIDEDISTDLVTLFEQLNWKNIVQLGLADAGRPNFKTIEGKNVDPDAAAARFAQIGQAYPGAKVREDEFYEGLDLTPVGDGDKYVTLGAQPAAPEGEDNPLFPAAPEGGAPPSMKSLPIGVRRQAAAYMRAGCSRDEAVRLALDTDGEDGA